MWVRVDCAKTVRRNAPLESHDGRVGLETLPTSLSVDACSRILHKSWSHRNCSASALKCGASYCVSLEQTEREAQPVMLAFTFMGTTRELFADMKSVYVALEARNAMVDCPSIVVGDSLSLQGCIE